MKFKKKMAKTTNQPVNLFAFAAVLKFSVIIFRKVLSKFDTIPWMFLIVLNVQ